MLLRAAVAVVFSAFLVFPALGQTRPADGQESSILDRLLAPGARQPEGAEVVARYDQAVVTRDVLVDFLMQTRGLDALLNLMQLQIAKTLAANEGVVVTPEDVKAEERETLRLALQAAGMAHADEEQYAALSEQLLAQQQLSKAEFDVVMATNAYLKALARPQIEKALTEENLRKAFNARYGEQVRVRHIQLENRVQLAEVKRRLDAGEDFARVAGEVSSNADTRQVGGMFPPFSMQSAIPEAFKLAAFELEVGQVSDPVEAGGFLHLIKLEERIAPKAVRFEDVKEDLKKAVTEEQVLVVTTRLRRVLAQNLASENLQVLDPVLAEQLRGRLEQVRPQPLDPEAMKRQMESERPTTGPATGPAGE